MSQEVKNFDVPARLSWKEQAFGSASTTTGELACVRFQSWIGEMREPAEQCEVREPPQEAAGHD